MAWKRFGRVIVNVDEIVALSFFGGESDEYPPEEECELIMKHGGTIPLGTKKDAPELQEYLDSLCKKKE